STMADIILKFLVPLALLFSGLFSALKERYFLLFVFLFFIPSLTDNLFIFRELFLWRKIRQIFFNGFAIIGAFIPNFRDRFLTFKGQFLQKNYFPVPPMAD